MLLVFSYSAADLPLAEALARFLPKLGPYSDHDLLLCPAVSVAHSLPEIRAALEPLFRKTYEFIVPAPDLPWPLGTGRMFHAIGMHIYQSVPAANGWYYFEADNCPTRPGWLDELGAEYAACGRPFMGATAQTVWQGIGPERKIFDGYHLVGTAIYPANLAQRSALFRALRDVPTPFDVYLQWEIMPQSHVTKLICHEWCTHLYTRDKKTGIIIGQLARDYRSWQPRAIPSDAVVVHGCKDLSLLNIYRGLLTGYKAQLPKEELVS